MAADPQGPGEGPCKRLRSPGPSTAGIIVVRQTACLRRTRCQTGNFDQVRDPPCPLVDGAAGNWFDKLLTRENWRTVWPRDERKPAGKGTSTFLRPKRPEE